MSIKVMSLVWDNFETGGSEKLAMLALADWCDDNGLNLYPSIATVAKKICVSEKQARRIIHKLIEEGYLAVIGNEHGGAPSSTRRYQLIVKKLVATPPASVTPPMDVTPPAGVPDPSHGCPLPLPPMGANPSLTINKATANKPKRELPDWLPEKELEEFIAYRKGLKKPMTDKAVTLLIGELEKLVAAGHDPIACLNQAILKGWLAPYAPKTQLTFNGGVQAARLDTMQQIFGGSQNGNHGQIIDITPTGEAEGDGAGVSKTLACVR